MYPTAPVGGVDQAFYSPATATDDRSLSFFYCRTKYELDSVLEVYSTVKAHSWVKLVLTGMHTHTALGAADEQAGSILIQVRRGQRKFSALVCSCAETHLRYQWLCPHLTSSLNYGLFTVGLFRLHRRQMLGARGYLSAMPLLHLHQSTEVQLNDISRHHRHYTSQRL